MVNTVILESGDRKTKIATCKDIPRQDRINEKLSLDIER